MIQDFAKKSLERASQLPFQWRLVFDAMLRERNILLSEEFFTTVGHSSVRVPADYYRSIIEALELCEAGIKNNLDPQQEIQWFQPIGKSEGPIRSYKIQVKVEQNNE